MGLWQKRGGFGRKPRPRVRNCSLYKPEATVFALRQNLPLLGQYPLGRLAGFQPGGKLCRHRTTGCPIQKLHSVNYRNPGT